MPWQLEGSIPLFGTDVRFIRILPVILHNSHDICVITVLLYVFNNKLYEGIKKRSCRFCGQIDQGLNLVCH